MDPYTDSTRSWLDKRFRQTDREGVYVAHQPIYGFRGGHCETWATRYLITWNILRALSRLDFRSLVDFGGAEGYQAALVRDLFDAEVYSCDLAESACVRAKDIFGVDGEPVDIHSLPFADNQFDVVVCSETLEHVVRLEDATRELMRVARVAVVVTVPHEPPEVIEKNIREGVPHGHIHAFDPSSFDFVRSELGGINCRRQQSPWLRIALTLVEAEPKVPDRDRGLARYVITKLYNRSVPALRRVLGPRAEAILMRCDSLVVNVVPRYENLLFVLVKDGIEWSNTTRRKIAPSRVIEYQVPLHYPLSRF